jgi:two-component system sensor histidine kinase TctE
MDATISHRMEANESQTLSVTVLVEEVVGRLDPDLRPRVRTRFGDGAATAVIEGDRVGLREMLRNLIGNALAYSDGVIDVEASVEPENRVRLAVLDRGPGIPDADKSRVLQRFVRGQGVEGKVGSGLGLAIAQRVVEGHAGQLVLQDRSGGGLEVIALLPAGTTKVADVSEPDARRVPGPHRRAILLLVTATLCANLVPDRSSAEPLFFPAQQQETRRLAIAGTTDTALFKPFLQGFQTANPGLAITYLETDSIALFRGFLAGTLDPAPDLLISSASDLQLKLANDGHAISHASPWLAQLPSWAQWRGEVIGFTYEPAVIIYNPTLLPPGTQPRTHRELAELLERDPTRFTGRVATYDIARSGVGYLLASQDQQISSHFWRLAAAFGRVEARLSDSSPEILDNVANGNLLLGYNVLGSYAFARQAEGVPIGIVVPDDYVLVLTRSMLIPRKAANPDLAQAFVDFALSPAGQGIAAGRSALGAVMPGSPGMWTMERISTMGQGVVQPIILSPVLMVALDPQRRSGFLSAWQRIVNPSQP